MAPDDPRSAAMAVDALRRGWPVRIAASGTADTEDEAGEPGLIVLAVETANRVSLCAFDTPDRADLLIAHGRAATLNIVNQRAAAGATGKADTAVLVSRETHHDLEFATALADPARDLATPFKGPFVARDCASPGAAHAALALARHAGLLPTFFVHSPIASNSQIANFTQYMSNTTSATAVAAYANPARVQLVARAALPIEMSENCEIIAFRSPEDPAEHIALVVGTRDAGPPLVRLHSECLTGDVFGSLKCDCGPQLRHALARMRDAGAAQSGWGVLLYLRQEGRGIGLINKLRAYQLQDQGYDTVDANIRLGFPIEARDFGIAGAMLHQLDIASVRLLTNNPQKAASLRAAGIEVIEIVPHILPANPHNAQYLATKRDRTGHQL